MIIQGTIHPMHTYRPRNYRIGTRHVRKMEFTINGDPWIFDDYAAIKGPAPDYWKLNCRTWPPNIERIASLIAWDRGPGNITPMAWVRRAGVKYPDIIMMSGVEQVIIDSRYYDFITKRHGPRGLHGRVQWYYDPKENTRVIAWGTDGVVGVVMVKKV